MTDITTDILLDKISAFRAMLPEDQRTRFTAITRDSFMHYAALPPEQRESAHDYPCDDTSISHNSKTINFICTYNRRVL